MAADSIKVTVDLPLEVALTGRVYTWLLVEGDVAWFEGEAWDVIEVVKGGPRLHTTKPRETVWVVYRRQRDGHRAGWNYGGLAGHDLVRVSLPRPEGAI